MAAKPSRSPISPAGAGTTVPAPRPVGSGITDPNSPEGLTRLQGQLNRINVGSPFGTIQFLGDDRDRAQINLSRDQQQILDLLEGGQIALGRQALGAIPNLPFGRLDLSSLPALPADAEGARAAAEEAVFGRGLRLLDPIFEKQERRLEQRLANQGIPVGSEAFDEDFRSFNTGRDQALLDLSDRAVLAGGQEASRILGDTILSRGQALTERAQPMNEILTLLGLQQVQQPTIFPPAQVDVLGPQQVALQQDQLAQQGRQFQTSQRNDLLGGVLGLGGTLGAAAILGK